MVCFSLSGFLSKVREIGLCSDNPYDDLISWGPCRWRRSITSAPPGKMFWVLLSNPKQVDFLYTTQRVSFFRFFHVTMITLP